VAKLALRARLVRPAPRALKASKDPSVPRAQSESRGRLALRDHKDQSARRGRREMRVAKAQSDPPASADHQGRKVPRAHPAPPDQPARRATRARPRQFASSRVRIPLGAETTKSWPVSCAQAAPATERSARPLERQQLVYAHVVDLSRPDHGASLAGVPPCRTGAASFMVARARGRARRRASSAAGGQIGNTGTIRGKPMRNGRACARRYLRSAICAARSNGASLMQSPQ
jgi:hypothetical protein